MLATYHRMISGRSLISCRVQHLRGIFGSRFFSDSGVFGLSSTKTARVFDIWSCIPIANAGGAWCRAKWGWVLSGLSIASPKGKGRGSLLRHTKSHSGEHHTPTHFALLTIWHTHCKSRGSLGPCNKVRCVVHLWV